MKTILALLLPLLLVPGCGDGHTISCDAGANADAATDVRTFTHCDAPANGHATAFEVQEPDGTWTCLPGACDNGWADCDGNPENGCEAQLTGAEWCGDCLTRCESGQVCHPDGAGGHTCQ